MKNGLCLATFAAVALSFAGCAGDQSHDADSTHASAEATEPAQGTEAVAHIEPTEGNTVTGTATFRAAGGSVTMELVVENAPPGEHAFHLHQIGDCSAPDGSSAGGHWNPTGEDHGAWGTAPFHLGDVGNLEVGEDGRGTIRLTTDLWSVRTGADNDVVGRAVIVHAGVDDFTTQPTGAAGGRIGCGVIE
jgi:Cu-Zn family superoxide dismutase